MCLCLRARVGPARDAKFRPSDVLAAPSARAALRDADLYDDEYDDTYDDVDVGVGTAAGDTAEGGDAATFDVVRALAGRRDGKACPRLTTRHPESGLRVGCWDGGAAALAGAGSSMHSTCRS